MMTNERTGRRAAAVPGGRHIHAIRAEYTDMLASLPGYRLAPQDLRRWMNSTTAVLETLDDPETRRIVVDSEQALRFVEANGLPPIQRYRMPFAQMYIEMTTPIDIGDQEPGWDDLLVARMTHRPSPWHIVTVDPTLVSDEDAEGGGRRGPAFRFDVRGHLRFGRHPRRDGTYSTTVEWVRPHQRGLANAVYVPKTSLYDAKSPRVDILDGS